MVPATESPSHWLKTSALFCSVPEEDLAALHPPSEFISLISGQVLIRQGDCDTDYYHLVTGQLLVQSEQPGREPQFLAHIKPGEGVGEMSLLTGDPRSATVIARLDSTLVRVRQSALLDLIARNPATALEIARVVIQRLKRAPKVPNYKCIAVLPLHPGIDCAMIARELAEHLGPFGRSRCFPTRSEVPDLQSDLADLAYAVFDGTVIDRGNPTPWSRHCLLQADLILFVTAAGTKPESNFQTQFLGPGINPALLGRTDLLIVHPGRWLQNSGTASWISALRRNVAPREHHHLRTGVGTDFARLARIIAGKSVNIVLGGGGALSFSQFGVLRAIQEAGIPIDRVAGCSMGAFIGSVLATGANLDDAITLVGERLNRRRPARDFTLPVHSIFRGRRMEQFMVDICGDWRIEDLPLRFLSIAVDLNAAELLVHTDGPVRMALRAGGAVPVLAPPLFIDGRVLVDGSTLNNLPVDIMQERHSGSVIAVDVMADPELKAHPKWNLTCPSGFAIVWDRFNPFKKSSEIPGILDILRRTLRVSSQSRLGDAREKADWLIQPPVAGYGLVEFGKFDELVELGYRHTIRQLETTNLREKLLLRQPPQQP